MPNNNFNQRGFSQILLLILILVVLLPVAASNIKTTQKFSDDQRVKGVLLAKGGEDGGGSSGNSGSSGGQGSSGDSHQSDSSGSNNTQGSSGGTSGTSGGSNSEIKIKNEVEPQKIMRTEIKPQSFGNSAPVTNTKVGPTTQTERNEIRISENERVKTRVENDKTRTEIREGGLKIRYEIENGKLRIKAENEKGEEAKLKEDEVKDLQDEIEQELEDEGIEIATNSARPTFTKNGVTAQTNFPLSVNLNTSQLVVTTPAGQKAVAVLPDQAIQNLLSKGILSKVNSSSELSSGLGESKNIIELETKNNEVIYKVKGKKSHKLFRIIPIETETTAFVSAETGEPLESEQTVLANIINFLSF